jgi:hypothetical protein
MILDFMLRTRSEREMNEALLESGLLKMKVMEGEEVFYWGPGVEIDYIGQIPDILDEDGYVQTRGDSGYHANLRTSFELTAEQLSSLPIVTPTPTTPYRVFF